METHQEELLQELCCLYVEGEKVDALALITQSAGITAEEKKKIPQEKMDDFILKERADPCLHKMVEIARAFSLADRICDYNTETNSEEALLGVEKLEKIIPYAHPEDQIYIKEKQARCYRYVELTDDEQDNDKRYKLYKDVLENYPAEDRDVFLKFWAKEINDLNVSPVAKYEALKSAQRRSSDYGKCAYKKELAPLAEIYFSYQMERAKNSDTPFSEKIKNVKQAKDAIEDIDISQNTINSYLDNPRKLQELRDIKHHRYELAALGLLKTIYKDNNNGSDAKAVSLQIGKAQNLFYHKYPWLKVQRDKASVKYF